MAPQPPRRLAALVLVAVALAGGCSREPAPETDVADATAPPAAPDTPPAGDGAPSVPDPPDLSGRVIDCDAVDGPCDRGDDADLDVLWEACEQGHGRACDRLYYDAGFDTRYEQFGNTCGDRDLIVPCPGELGSPQPTRSRL